MRLDIQKEIKEKQIQLINELTNRYIARRSGSGK